MYYQYFGLTEAPFSIAVDPRYLFMSPRHRDALAHLLYGVGSGDGFILLTGEVGTGKTTINRCLLEQLPQDTDMAIVMNPALNAIELLATVCDELHIDYDSQNYSLKTLTDKLHAFLLENHARGRKTVLLIDEAQHLDFDVLEQIRLLTNLETNSEKLLQIILIGQPELGQMLARPELRQLNQRITARYNLEPLTVEETGAYIHHRLQVAGMSADRVIFPASVVRDIHRATLGIPRVINKLCDRVLLGAYGRNKSRADKSMLQLAIREVLGEDAVQAVTARWLLPVVAVVLALAAGAWWWQSNSGWSWPQSADSVRPQAQSVQEPLQAAPEAAERLPEPAAPERSLVTAVPEPPAPVAGAAAALLPAGRALEILWQVQTGEAAPDNTCPASLQRGLVCVAAAATTWDELMTFDRPLALAMVTPERFSADVLLLGIDGTNAWVYTLEGVVMVPLAELAPGWTGRYSYLWQPPAGYTKPLALGDSGPVVAEVAQLFARLDSRDRPLADTVFNAGLEHRVRMFQVEHDLEDDGVVGVLTLLRLNELLDIDPSARAARQQLDQNSEGDPR